MLGVGQGGVEVRCSQWMWRGQISRRRFTVQQGFSAQVKGGKESKSPKYGTQKGTQETGNSSMGASCCDTRFMALRVGLS